MVYTTENTYQFKDCVPFSFQNAPALMEKIDSLPPGPGFRCIETIAHGDQEDAEGSSSEVLELWVRDPVDCIKELIGNPAFAEHMRYSPVKKWRGSRNPKHQIYDEAWTGDWWWNTQVCTVMVCLHL